MVINAITITPDFTWLTEIFTGFSFIGFDGILGVILSIIITFSIIRTNEFKGLLFPISLSLHLSGITVNLAYLSLTGLICVLDIVSINTIVDFIKVQTSKVSDTVSAVNPWSKSNLAGMVSERQAFKQQERISETPWGEAQVAKQRVAEREQIKREFDLRKELSKDTRSLKQRVREGVESKFIKSKVEEAFDSLSKSKVTPKRYEEEEISIGGGR